MTGLLTVAVLRLTEGRVLARDGHRTASRLVGPGRLDNRLIDAFLARGSDPSW